MAELMQDFQTLVKKLVTNSKSIEDEFNRLLTKITVLETQNNSFLTDINTLRKNKEVESYRVRKLESELETKKAELEIKIQSVENEKMLTESEKFAIEKELERVAKLYEDVTGKEAESEDLSNLLGLYITLIERVFSGKIAFKTLSIMHGDKQKWTRAEIAKSIGVSEIDLRLTLGELARAELIEYNEETSEAFLKKKIGDL